MKRAGVFELPTVQRLEFQSLVTFGEKVLGASAIDYRSGRIADMAMDTGAMYALLGVPSFMISTVEDKLLQYNITPLHPWGTVYRYSVESESDSAAMVRCAYRVLEFIEVCSNGGKRIYGA